MKTIFWLGALILIISIVLIIFLIILINNQYKKRKKTIEQYLAEGWEAIEKKDIYKAIDSYQKIKKIYRSRGDSKHEIRKRIRILYDNILAHKYLLK